jgi:hypothetical protein
MTDEMVRWQREHLAKARALVADFDLGAAARMATAKGGELTAEEFEGCRWDARVTIWPSKVLVFDGARYSYA